MMLYSDYPGARAWQITADAVAVVLMATVAVLATAVAAGIRALGAFGRDLEAAGGDVRAGFSEAAEALGSVPIIGDGIRGPFDLAAHAGASLAEAGRAQQAAVELTATLTVALMTLVPLAVLGGLWLAPRIRFVRRKRELRRMIAAGMSADTLAARAVAQAPLRRLAAVHPDPAAAWRESDPTLLRALAAVELRRAGIAPSALP